MELDSYFDGQLFKNRVWVGIVEGQEFYFFFCHLHYLFYCFIVNVILVMQAFLSISLSLIIQISSFGEGHFMGSMMISNVFHILVVQHLSYFSKLAKNQT